MRDIASPDGGPVHLGQRRNHHLVVTTYMTVGGEWIWQNQIQADDESTARSHAIRLLDAGSDFEGAVIDRCWDEVVQHDGGTELIWQEQTELLDIIRRAG